MPIGRYYKGHGDEVMDSMQGKYGEKKGKEVFYATANKRGLKRMQGGDMVEQQELDPNDPLYTLAAMRRAREAQAQAAVPQRVMETPDTPPATTTGAPMESPSTDQGISRSTPAPDPVVTTVPPPDLSAEGAPVSAKPEPIPTPPAVVPQAPQAAAGQATPPQPGPSGDFMTALEGTEERQPTGVPPKRAMPYTEKMFSEGTRLADEKPVSKKRQVLGSIMQGSPTLRGVGRLVTGQTQREQALERLKLRGGMANEEQQLQTHEDNTGLRRSQIELNDAYRKRLADDKMTLADRPKIVPSKPIQMPNPADGNKVWNYEVERDPVTGVITNRPVGPYVAVATGGGQPRELGSNVITLENAKKLKAQTGEKFPRRGGGEWDLEQVPPGMQMHRVGSDPSSVYYDVIDPRQYVTTAENQQYVTSGQERSQIGTGGTGVTPIGRQRTGSVNTREQIATDPGGKTTVNTLINTQTPNTGPVRGGGLVPPIRPVGGTAPPAATPQGAVAPQVPGVQPPQITAAPPQAPTGAPAGRVLNPPPAAREQQMRVIRPIREAAIQIFGDPAQPHMKSLKDFAGLADDPQARARTAKFLRLTFDAMKKQEGGHAGVGAALGPVSVSTGGFGQWLQELAHIPGGVAEFQTQRMERALQDMTGHPDELAYVDALLAARSAAVGLRAATGGGAYQFSVEALEQDLPVLGINTNSRSQYLDKLQHVAAIAANGVKGYDPRLMDQDSPGLYGRIRGLTTELEQMKTMAPQAPRAPQAPTGRPGAPTNPNPNGYVVGQRYGGLTYLGPDPNQATSWRK